MIALSEEFNEFREITKERFYQGKLLEKASDEYEINKAYIIIPEDSEEETERTFIKFIFELRGDGLIPADRLVENLEEGDNFVLHWKYEGNGYSFTFLKDSKYILDEIHELDESYYKEVNGRELNFSFL